MCQISGADRAPVVGIYRIVMRLGSDTFRVTVIQRAMKWIRAKEVNAIVFAPDLKVSKRFHPRVVNDLAAFEKEADVIIANRQPRYLNVVSEKIYTRDSFGHE